MRFYLVLIVAALSASAVVAGQTNTPSVYFENTSRDVGTVTQGEIIKQVFSFVNKGPGTLEILDVGHS